MRTLEFSPSIENWINSPCHVILYCSTWDSFPFWKTLPNIENFKNNLPVITFYFNFAANKLMLCKVLTECLPWRNWTIFWLLWEVAWICLMQDLLQKQKKCSKGGGMMKAICQGKETPTMDNQHSALNTCQQRRSNICDYQR